MAAIDLRRAFNRKAPNPQALKAWEDEQSKLLDLERAYSHRRFGPAGIRRSVRGPENITAAAPVTPAPETITGLRMWLDPASVYVTRDVSDRASIYVSREGNAYSFTAAGSAQPLWEASGILGQPSLYFTTDDVMACAGAIAALMDGTDEYSLVAVNSCTAPGAGQYGTPLSLGTDASTATQISHRITGTAGNDAHYRGAAGGTGFSSTGSQALTSPNYLRVDKGATTIATSVDNTTSIASESWSGSYTFDRVYLGASRYSGAFNSFLTGRLGDIFVYDHILTAGEWTTLRTFIEAKYVGIV